MEDLQYREIVLEERTSHDRAENERKKIGAPFDLANSQVYVTRAATLLMRQFYSPTAFNDLDSYVKMTTHLHHTFHASENECNNAMVFALSRPNGNYFNQIFQAHVNPLKI